MVQTDEHAPEAHSANIKVTEMNEKRLTLKIRKQTTSFSEEEEEAYKEEECPSSADIEVVHSRAPPSLHGILKQRSMSESSEDHSSGDSPTSCSPRDSDSSGGKRSVTFNSHIDKATYKTNATVTSMKQAMKSKRKRNRKRDEKKREKEGRRRHNSNGSEYSSCDDEHDTRQSSESHSEDDHEPEDLAQLLEETGKKVEDYGVIEEDQEESDEKSDQEVNTEENKQGESDVSKQPGYQIHCESSSKSERKESKLVAQVKSKMAEKKQDSEENDSDDDAGDESDERTTVNDGKKSVMTRDENQQKDVNMTSASSENQENGNGSDLSVAENGKNPSKAANQDSGEVNLNGDTISAIKGNNPGKGSQKKGVKFKDDVKEVGADEKGDGVDKGQEPEPVKSDVETELSWRDVKNQNVPYNEHRTQCAFNFSNDVVFDLDID